MCFSSTLPRATGLAGMALPIGALAAGGRAVAAIGARRRERLAAGGACALAPSCGSHLAPAIRGLPAAAL
jgi:hypothetical protein